jgi:hypothetical protein
MSIPQVSTTTSGGPPCTLRSMNTCIAQVWDVLVLDRQITLPTNALAPFAEARAALELAPWNGAPYHRNRQDSPMRALTSLA